MVPNGRGRASSPPPARHEENRDTGLCKLHGTSTGTKSFFGMKLRVFPCTTLLSYHFSLSISNLSTAVQFYTDRFVRIPEWFSVTVLRYLRTIDGTRSEHFPVGSTSYDWHKPYSARLSDGCLSESTSTGYRYWYKPESLSALGDANTYESCCTSTARRIIDGHVSHLHSAC